MDMRENSPDVTWPWPWPCPPDVQLQQDSLNTNLHVSEDVEQGVKRAIPAMVEAIKETIHIDQDSRSLIPLIVEAVKKEILPVVEVAFSKFSQECMASIQGMIGEALLKMSNNSTSRSLPHDVESPILRTLQLRFVGTLPNTFYTFNDIKAEEDGLLEVELVDMSGTRIQVGPESSAKIKFVVLEGDYEVDNSEENFNEKVVKARKVNPNLLKGKCIISLTQGIATVSGLVFADNSSHTTDRHFRLGAQMVKALPGIAVREAVSEEFRVKERRSLCCGKKKNPSLGDKVICLKNMGPKLSQQLADKEVHTVQDLLQLYNTDPTELRKVLRVSDNKLSEIINNANSCSLPDKCYQYPDDDTERINIVLDCVFNIKTVAFKNGITQSFETLDEYQKKLIDKIRRDAYEKRRDLQGTLIPISQTPVQVEPFNPYIPHNTMYTNVTAKAGELQIQSNISCFSPDVVSFPSQPTQHIDETQKLSYVQNTSGWDCQISYDFNSDIAGTSNYQTHPIIDQSYESPRSPRWKKIQCAARMIWVYSVSVKRGVSVYKRQKLDQHKYFPMRVNNFNDLLTQRKDMVN